MRLFCISIEGQRPGRIVARVEIDEVDVGPGLCDAKHPTLARLWAGGNGRNVPETWASDAFGIYDPGYYVAGPLVLKSNYDPFPLREVGMTMMSSFFGK